MLIPLSPQRDQGGTQDKTAAAACLQPRGERQQDRRIKTKLQARPPRSAEHAPAQGLAASAGGAADALLCGDRDRVLAIANMTRSAKGADFWRPARMSRPRPGSIGASLKSVGAGCRKLDPNSVRDGAVIVPVAPTSTSQTCSVCSYRAAENRRSQAVFVCGQCGHREMPTSMPPKSSRRHWRKQDLRRSRRMPGCHSAG